MTKLSILICGKIRDRSEFERDLTCYVDLLACGAVEKIVFSGWATDLDENSDLFREMTRAGLRVILSDEPFIKSRGHVLHQAKSLHQGLREFPSDAWVYKTRTDKVSWSLDFDIASLASKAEQQTPAGPNSPFSRRVLVMGALVFQPFFFSDQIFVGAANDLMKIASYDVWFAFDHCLLNTEQMLFFPPFRYECPFTEAFFSVNPGLRHGQPELTEQIHRFLLDKPLYQHSLKEFVQALQSSFTLGLFSNDNSAPPPDLSWSDMLDRGATVPGSYVPEESSLRFITSDALAKALPTMPIHPGGHSLDQLRSTTTDKPDIRRMRDELCAALFEEWSDLPNIRRPDAEQDGLRVVSSREALLG